MEMRSSEKREYIQQGPSLRHFCKHPTVVISWEKITCKPVGGGPAGSSPREKKRQYDRGKLISRPRGSHSGEGCRDKRTSWTNRSGCMEKKAIQKTQKLKREKRENQGRRQERGTDDATDPFTKEEKSGGQGDSFPKSEKSLAKTL